MKKPTIRSHLALLAVACLTACAATDATTPSGERPAPRQYRTGSNVPIRDSGPAVSDVRTIEREQMERAGGAEVSTSGTPGGTPPSR